MEYAILTLLSFVACIFGALVGAGGGFILVPALLFLHSGDPAWSPALVTFMGLFIALCNGISSTATYGRMGRIDWRTGLIFGVSTMIPAVAGRLVVSRLDAPLFSMFFGCFMMAIALWLLRNAALGRAASASERPLRPGLAQRHLTDVDGIEYRYAFSMPLGVSLSSGVGFLATFFGVGGGIIQVPIMTQLLRIPVLVATATSMFLLLISASTGVATYFIGGGRLDPWWALCLGAGALAGGQVGARLARRVKGKVVLVLLAIGLALAGARLIYRFLN